MKVLLTMILWALLLVLVLDGISVFNKFRKKRLIRKTLLRSL